MGTSGDEQVSAGQGPVFYTVAEAAALLRIDRATLYRAIRDDAFPAVRVRSRYVIPASAVQEMAAQAVRTGACVDVAAIAARRRVEREAGQALGFRTGRG
jgi:excisionase family DNA binding protein